MSRRRLPLTLAVVGVLIIVAALIAATVVRSSDTVTLALGERPDVPVVITEPGVLDAVDSEVTVRATADDDEPVLLAIGRSSDVEAWLGDADHARVTGLSSWEELTVEVVTGGGPDGATGAPADDATAAPAEGATDVPAGDAEGGAALPNPADSDLWVVQTVSTGTAELTWTDSPGRWSLVAATDGTGPAPTVELEWGRQVATPWLIPAIVVGALALVAGVTMLVLDVLARREQRRRDDARASREAGDTDAASITDTDPATGERVTRRGLRETPRVEGDLGDGRAGVPPVPLAPGAVGDVDDVTTAEPGATAGDITTEPGATAADVTTGAHDTAEADGVTTAGPAAGAPGLGTARDGGDGDAPADEDEGRSGSGSWRSVWGFGRGAGGRAAPPDQSAPGTTDHTDQHEDGGER